MLQHFADRVRTFVHDALASSSGNHIRPIRVVREVLGTANDLAGRPFCTQAELDRRRGRHGAASSTAKGREAAPIMVYFDGRDHRTLKKIEDLLKGGSYRYQVLDVTDDEATRSWATTAARNDEFPLVFVGGDVVGGLHELTRAEVNGELRRRVTG